MDGGTLSRFTLPRPWFKKVDRCTLGADALAGLTNAAIVLPQGVAFAVVAGLPPEYGLYTAMITPVIAAIWGSSTILVSGPTTAISAVVFATLSDLAEPGTSDFVTMALTLTIVAGLFQIVAGLFRLGGLVTFVSHSVIVGFTAAAALLIAASQLAGALGLTVERGGGVIERLARVAEAAPEANLKAAAIALITLLVIPLAQRLGPKVPAYLIALAVGSLAGLALGAEEAGIAMFAPLPSILPTFAPPAATPSTIIAVLPGAASIALVGLLESLSIGRSFALRRREAYDSNQEIIGQGLSNTIGGFFQAYAGAGSFTRSALNAETGARTPLAAILAAGFLLAMLFVVAPLVDRIPVPAMAGIILFVAYRLIDRREIRHILNSSRSETLILLLTFLAGIVIDLEASIFVGLVTSLAVFLHRSAHPFVSVLAPAILNGRRQLRGAVLNDLPQCPDILILRIDGPCFFASVEHLESRFRRIEQRFPQSRSKILQLKGIGRLDLSGADFLVVEIGRARRAGGDFRLVAGHFELVRELERLHVIDVLGRDNLHPTKGEAIAAAVAAVPDDICRSCTARVFVECAERPSPDDVPGARDPTVLDGIVPRPSG